jgi:hypothetical protein
MPKALQTKASVWSKVFRRIVQQIEQNPDIRRVVGVDNIRSWSGVDADKAPMVPSSGAPIIRLTPNPANVSWYDPSSQAGTLTVRVEIVIQSLCVDDVADLWDLIVVAIRPGNYPFTHQLVELGAITGEAVFFQPAVDPKPEAQPEGYLLAEGRFRLDVQRSVSP